ncbi:hypothetical protein EC973_001701 [Apophysomyces ossiformis]|uniref:PLC-like phosphodiesterase n=1 Tax=Apophysomyces ossiformis TaxID=679940 RepID=A0A8H7END0_9FUNG|nr:hypothetical protein EC973_001701 [Apophysomyces ossiformis]
MFLVICVLVIVVSIVPVYSDNGCNGHPDLCSRPYNNVTYLVTHDSYAYGLNVAATQSVPIIKQLEDGVRGLKFSAVPIGKEIHLCHTFCAILDSGPAKDTLNELARWLQKNPTEVVTIMWNNLYDVEATVLANAYSQSSIMPYVYTHPNLSQPWPTLQDMIDAGKRVVNFIDSQANVEEIPWLMYQFSYVFETPYDNTDEHSFKCTIDRPAGLDNADNMMYLLNHFLYGVISLGSGKIEIPRKDRATFTNSQSLADHITACSQAFNRTPNFIEVDFYDEGKALALVDQLNGIPTKHPVTVKSDPLPGQHPNLPTITDVSDLWKLVPTHLLLDSAAFRMSASLAPILSITAATVVCIVAS